MNKKRIYIISELCGQWGGSVKKAEQMILQSKFSGADAVKVQLFDTYKLPGENRKKWEYLAMLEWQLKELQNFAAMLNIDFFASAFDLERNKWTRHYGLCSNKIASSLLEWDYELCKNIFSSEAERGAAYGYRSLYVSLGKWTNKKALPFTEIEMSADEKYYFENYVKFFHCHSVYPHGYTTAMDQMPKTFTDQMNGYSDHSVGIEACKEAVIRGATIIEKHFTLDKSYICETESAHTCSMDWRDLEELKKWCEQCRS